MKSEWNDGVSFWKKVVFYASMKKWWQGAGIAKGQRGGHPKGAPSPFAETYNKIVLSYRWNNINLIQPEAPQNYIKYSNPIACLAFASTPLAISEAF